MSHFCASFLPPGARLLCAAAALCTTGALAALLLSAWHHQADPFDGRAGPAGRCSCPTRRPLCLHQRSSRGPSSAPSTPAAPMPAVYQTATKLGASSSHDKA